MMNFEIVQAAMDEDENMLRKTFFDNPQNIREDLHVQSKDLNTKWEKYLK